MQSITNVLVYADATMVTINIKTLRGDKFAIEVDPSSTVMEVKQQIDAENKDKELPADRLKLIHQGKVLCDEKLLSEYNVKPQEFLVVMATQRKAGVSMSVGEGSASAVASGSASALGGASAPAPAPAPVAPPAPAPAPAPAPGPPQASVSALVEMGFPEAMVMQALAASGHNQDVALDFLLSGNIPPPQPNAHATGTQAHANAPVELSLPVGSAASGLASHPHIHELRRLVAEAPGEMEGALARLQTDHPDLMALINAHPEEFWQVLNGEDSSGVGTMGMGAALMEEGDDEDDEGMGTAHDEGAPLTDADEAAIDRLMEIMGGSTRDQVTQAYLIAGKDENGAINMLLG